jgi:hypothetical protein
LSATSVSQVRCVIAIASRLSTQALSIRSCNCAVDRPRLVLQNQPH